MDDGQEEQLRKVPLWKSDPAFWPDNVRPIASEEMDNLGVDCLGNLYRAGKPVVVKRIALSKEMTSWGVFIAIITRMTSISVIPQELAVTHAWLGRLNFSPTLQCVNT